jgi:hypothetical protein
MKTSLYNPIFINP